MKYSILAILIAFSLSTNVNADENNKGFLDYKKDPINNQGTSGSLSIEQENRIRMIIDEAILSRNGHVPYGNPLSNDPMNQEEVNEQEDFSVTLDFSHFDYSSYKVTAESDTFYLLVDGNGLRKILYKNEIDKLVEKLGDPQVKKKLQQQKEGNDNTMANIKRK